MIQTSAICLKQRPIGKTSAVLSFLCERLGPVSVYERGFQNASSKIKPLFDLGQEVCLALTVKEERYYLSEMILKQGFDLTDYRILVFSSFLFELLCSWQDNPPTRPEQLYQELIKCLHDFSEKKKIFGSFLCFQIRLLEAYGLAGSLKQCGECSQRFPEHELCRSEENTWNFLCSSCHHKTGRKKSILELSPEERHALSHYLQDRNRHSVLSGDFPVKIQTHLMRIYEEWGTFKSGAEIMRLIQSGKPEAL
ncbi:MAG: DNA repair protein RecO [Candidatus Aureabacteria bacterium]|nr:DNA repair protein RecO [Candidatus Auribacterota bacterium]